MGTAGQPRDPATELHVSTGLWHREDPRCSAPGSPARAAIPGGHLWPCHSRSLPRPRSHSLVLGQAQPQGFPSHHAEGTVTTGRGQPGWSSLPTLPARAGLRGMRESPAGEPAPRRHRAPSRVSHGPVTAGTAPAAGWGGRTQPLVPSVSPRGLAAAPKSQTRHSTCPQFPARGGQGLTGSGEPGLGTVNGAAHGLGEHLGPAGRCCLAGSGSGGLESTGGGRAVPRGSAGHWPEQPHEGTGTWVQSGPGWGLPRG